MPTHTVQLTKTVNKTVVAFALVGGAAIAAMAFLSFSHFKPSTRLNSASAAGEAPVVEVPKTVSTLP